MICSLQCPIVRAAIERFEMLGLPMGEMVDAHKRNNERCKLCTRNEYATAPKDALKDMGVEQ